MANSERWKGFEDLPEDLGARLARLPSLLDERGVMLAYLFGSLAADDPSPGDVDLAVLMAEKPAYTLRADVQRALGTQRVDVVDLERASPLLRFHVIRDGQLLYARDDESLNRFELQTLHLYRDTAPLRRRHRELLRQRMDAWS